MARRKKKLEESVEEMTEQSQDAMLDETSAEDADSTDMTTSIDESLESKVAFPDQILPPEESFMEMPKVEDELKSGSVEQNSASIQSESISEEKPKEKPVERKKSKTLVKDELMQEYGDAIEWMTAKHEGQTDKNGVPYWTHPLIVSVRVKALAKAAKMDVRTAVLSALLHDVVEDGHASLQEVEYRYGKMVAKIVGILTRDPNLTYMEYIKNVVSSGNKMALIVKWADIAHNTSPNRVAKLKEKDRNRLSRKYANARKLIENAYPFLKEMGRKLDQKRKSR